MERATALESSHDLVERDATCLWHPYTQAKTAIAPVPIRRAKDAVLYTEEGERYIDAMSSWWVTLHGHGHPTIIEAIEKQLAELDHVMFAGFTHEPAVQLAEKLLGLLPKHFARVFYSDNGSTAVETALKIALQYWHNKGVKKKRILAFKDGYHGDTFGAMSVSGRSLFTTPFEEHLFEVSFIDPPVEDASLQQLQEQLETGEVGCFIFEPIVQAVSGMKRHSAAGLDRMLALCHEYEVITIADEVFTGLGRIGPKFASERLQHPPKVICIAKALTGGVLPLGVTACTEEIYHVFLSDQREKALLHGHSYCANPVACAAALATLGLLDSKKCEEQRHFIEQQHRAFQEMIRKNPKVASSHVTGTILCITYQTDEKSSYYNSMRDRLLRFFADRKVLIRPFGNTISVVPPYCITEKELQVVYQTILESLS